MAASWFLLLVLTLFQSLLICPSSEEYFPSASTINQWVLKMQNDLVTLARTASGVDQLAEIYLKNKNLYTVEANNARQLVESAATNIEKLLRNRSKALEHLAEKAEEIQGSHQWRDVFAANDVVYYNAKEDQMESENDSEAISHRIKPVFQDDPIFRRQTSYQHSAVHIPTDIYEGSNRLVHSLLINMESIKSKSKERGGAQKIREKRAKELDIAGKDPKQMKLSFAVGHGTTVPKERPTEVCTDQDRLPVRQDMLAKELDIAGKDPKQMKLSFAVGHGATVPKERPTEVCTDQDRLPVRQDVLVQEELRTHSPNSLIEELDFESSSEMTIIEKSPIPCSEATSLHDLESGRTEEESSSSDVQFDTTKTVFSLPSICSIAEKIAFVQMHPVQPSTTDCEGLPFKEIDFYFRRNPNGDLIRRSWLTCRVNNRKIEAFFCSICIAFSNSTSSFTSGCTNFRHCYQVANKHETSKTHREAVNTYFTITKSRGIDTLINQAHASKRKKEILQNIEVMKRIFDIVKLLAKQGLPFRAHGTNESLYNLSNAEINHGNFLEMVLFLSNYDVPLKNHIRKCISESERRKKQRRLLGKQTAGRGSLVTFLSYNTVKKVIMAIVQTMKSSIVSEIGEKRFSIQVDSTQDVGVVDQATVVVRYVKEESVKERLISVLPVKDSSGRGLNELLMSSFQILGLDYKKIAGESFDGAANMRSAYVGLRAQIAKEVPNAVYIWCYSHILNLCISDCCDVLEAKNFFGLLHRLATFIGDSHKRMNVWRDQLDKRCGHEKLLRLQKIGETRWWAKDKALHWLFGEKHSLFLDTLEVLLLISQFKQSDSKTTSEAASLSENLCLFKTILTAHLFLSIFDVIGPVSRYLQTSGLDYMVAWRMVESTVDQLKKIEFSYIQEKAKQFAKKINDLITEREGLDSLEVESELQERRIGRKKRMPGESSIDERPISETQRFRVKVFRPILDQIIGSLDERFSENKQLVQDSQYLDPRFFDKIRKDPNVLEAGALQRISQLSNVDESGLKTELQSFANLFPHLREQESGKVDMVPISCQQEEDDDDDDYLDNNPVNTDDDDWGSCTVDSMEQETKCKSCNKCFLCCHRFLVKYNLFSSAYENLSVVYEYLLTLSYTQVACERAFSKLKLIKTRLRATMGQELLDALMIMSVERDLLELVQFQDVLEKIRKTSPLMRSLLTV